MANEAVIIELPSNINAVRRTIADGSSGTNIEKGTLMKLTDPNTVEATSSSADEWGGVLAMEKVGGDGSTNCSVYLDGVFDMVAQDTITIGEQVAISGANIIRAATEAEVQLGQWIGVAEEASAAGSSETIRVRLRGH